jgi:carboxyl-terminal processing protease
MWFNRGRSNMNRILVVIFSLGLLFQNSFGAEFTRIQAGRIGNVVARILEQAHFRQQKMNDQVSETFLKNYLNALDYNHMIFLQSDVDEFTQKYGTKLDDATLNGDISPAYKVYDLYMERLAERVQLVNKLLKQEFDFSQDESVVLARNKEPWPKDDAESAKLWRQRIKYELLQGKLNKEKPEETIGVVQRRYQRLEKTMGELEGEDVVQMYLSALARAYDPHSDYMSPSEATNFDIQHISLSLTGIGAQLVWEDGYTKIKELIPGGPAALSKQIKPGDKIVAVGQGDEPTVDTVEMRLNKVVNMIRGKKGTEVHLTVIPAASPDTRKEIKLVRDEIKFVESFARARVYEFQDDGGKTQKLGVITLPQFYDNCAQHVAKLIQRLKKEEVNGLILDLRHNGGGILDEAVQLTGLFIKKGPVVQVKEPKHPPHVLEDKDADVAWDGPMVVMVGKLSASASEITAAALQDYGRAVLVGDQTTHGKGTVQQVLSLDNFLDPKAVPNPGKLKLTVSKFYRIAGGTTQKQGVTPDVILPSVWDYMDIGEASLENCLPADQTTPATYSTLDLVKPYLTELNAHSKDRVAKSKEFDFLREDIDQVKKRQEDKHISLNEKQRMEEKAQEKARVEARKKEHASRTAASKDHIFELSLDAAEKEKPLVPYAVKQKEDAELAANASKSSDPEEEPDLEAESPIDPQLDEGLAVLQDYIKLSGKSAKPAVVLKDR